MVFFLLVDGRNAADNRCLPRLLEPLAVEQKVLYPRNQHIVVEGLGDIGIGSVLIALYLLLVHGTCGEQYDGYVARHEVPLHVLAELQTVHHGHHHVGDNQVGHYLVGYVEALLAVLSLVDDVLGRQNGAQEDAYVGIVVDYEYLRSGVGGLELFEL